MSTVVGRNLDKSISYISNLAENIVVFLQSSMIKGFNNFFWNTFYNVNACPLRWALTQLLHK